MKTLIFTISILFLVLTSSTAGEFTVKKPQEELPHAVKSILDKTEKDALSLRLDYEIRLSAVLEKTEKNLLKQQEKLTKEGDLEGSLLVKEKIAAFKEEIAALMDELAKGNLENNRIGKKGDDIKKIGDKGFLPGLIVTEYPMHIKQEKVPVFVEEKELGTPIGESRIIFSLEEWNYTNSRNAVTKGYLKIEKSGEYAFNSNSGNDTNALYVNGKLLCLFRDGETTISRIQLKKGMVEIRSWGYVQGGGVCKVVWKVPGQLEMSPIPTELLFHSEAQK